MAIESMSVVQRADTWMRPEQSVNYLGQSHDNSYDKIFDDFIVASQLDSSASSSRTCSMDGGDIFINGSSPAPLHHPAGTGTSPRAASHQVGLVDLHRPQPCRGPAGPIGYLCASPTSPSQPQVDHRTIYQHTPGKPVISTEELFGLESTLEQSFLTSPHPRHSSCWSRSATLPRTFATRSPKRTVLRPAIAPKPAARPSSDGRQRTRTAQRTRTDPAMKMMRPTNLRTNATAPPGDRHGGIDFNVPGYGLNGLPQTLPMSPPPSAKLPSGESNNINFDAVFNAPDHTYNSAHYSHDGSVFPATGIVTQHQYAPVTSPNTFVDDRSSYFVPESSTAGQRRLPLTPYSAKTSASSGTQGSTYLQWTPDGADSSTYDLNMPTTFGTVPVHSPLWLSGGLQSPSSQSDLRVMGNDMHQTPHTYSQGDQPSFDQLDTGANLSHYGLGISHVPLPSDDEPIVGFEDEVVLQSMSVPDEGLAPTSPMTQDDEQSAKTSRSASPQSPRHKRKGASRRGAKATSPSSGTGFVNFTPSDSKKILTGVAPSGSSKTKARRDREAAEKQRKLTAAYVNLAKTRVLPESQHLEEI
ncbi:MAG: hypothetical protein M1825_006200 [Sarcosagium campestre]|nr:MAG: hypothetical protein M1825_006200 [Sarcosagium campestre]